MLKQRCGFSIPIIARIAKQNRYNPETFNTSTKFLYEIIPLTIVFLSIASSTATKGLLTTKEDSTLVEEAAEKIDHDENNENPSDHNASDGAWSKFIENFCDYTWKIKNE